MAEQRTAARSNNGNQQRQGGMPGRGPGGPGGPGRFGPKSKAKDAKGTLRRIWGYLGRHKARLMLFVVLVAVSSLLALVGPFMIGRTLDGVLETGDMGQLATNVIILASAYILSAGVTWLQTYVMAKVSQDTVHDMRTDLFSKLQTLSLRYFDTHAHGDIMSRLTNDIETVGTVLSESLSQFVSSALTIIGVTIAMLFLNFWLALVTLLVVPAMMALTKFIAGHTRRGYRQQQDALGEVNGIIEEVVSGERVVKAYVREDAEVEKFEGANRRLQSAATYANIYSGFMGPIMNMLNNLDLAIVSIAGGVFAVQGMITVGTIATFTSYAKQFGRPLNMVAQLFSTIQSAIAGAERVFQTLDEIPELEDGPDAVALDEIEGDVVFDDVSFSYIKGEPVLKNVSFHAEPGQTFALVGPTGAGKTTIVNLLTRFYDIDAGTIHVDGVDIRDAQKDTLRRQLGIVLQDNYLFADTVMANLRYGRLDATDAEVRQAAMLANADGFIRHMPQGYDSELAERGSNLSQGQRQLLSIARAMLADPRILILDEATSSVDTRTEKHIQEALLKLMEGRTSFVIAHRLSTIRDADCVLVVDEGEIVERGTHEELLAMKGFYYNLYMSQFRGKVAELVA